MRTRSQGFTLMELLVAMGLLGVILAAVLNVQVGLMADSVRVSGQANRLEELEDASSYLSDRLRSASAVSTALTINGQACTITSTTSPCFAVLTREFRDVGGVTPTSPNTYLYLAYQVIPRSSVPDDNRTVDAWADEQTYALVEYRRLACAPTAQPDNLTGAVSACSSSTLPTVIPSTLSSMEMNVLMDRVTMDKSPSTGTFSPFAYTAASRKFELNFRVKMNEQSKVRYTPADGPLSTVMQQRN